MNKSPFSKRDNKLMEIFAGNNKTSERDNRGPILVYTDDKSLNTFCKSCNKLSIPCYV